MNLLAAPRLTPAQAAAVRDLQQRLPAAWDVEALILFGSVARGDADDESDLDLLVITAQPVSPQDGWLTHLASEINGQYGTNVSPFLVDREAWEVGPFSVLPIRREIAQEGIVLAGPAAILAPSLRNTPMNQAQQRAYVIKHWWHLAEESLKAARSLMESALYTSAMNRVYYAAFYAASAVLLERQKRFKKHTGVQAAVHRDLIQPGILAVEWGKVYDDLFDNRLKGDYEELATFTRAEVETRLTRCAALLHELRQLLTTPLTEEA